MTRRRAGCPLLLLSLLPLAGLLQAAELPAQEEGLAPLEVEIGGSREVLSGDRSDWQEYHITLRQRFGPRQQLYLRLRQAVRFDLTDREAMLGGTTPLGEPWTLGAEVSFSPSPRFLPERSARGWLHRDLGGGWGIEGGAGLARYTTATLTTQHGRLERRFERFRTDYTLTTLQLSPGTSGVSHRVTGSWFYLPGAAVTAGVGAGREAESLPDEVRVVDTRFAGLWGYHPVQAGLVLTWSAVWHRRGDLYERTGVSVGFQHRL